MTPFGEQRSATFGGGAPANSARYAGERLDSTGLYHIRARQYQAHLGRFSSTDPVRPEITQPAVDTYGYVGGRPLLATDPSGQVAIKNDDRAPSSYGSRTRSRLRSYYDVALRKTQREFPVTFKKWEKMGANQKTLYSYFDYDTDLCTKSPDGNFTRSCVKHDFCLQNAYKWDLLITPKGQRRNHCNNLFKEDLARVCRSYSNWNPAKAVCWGRRWSYDKAVRSGNSSTMRLRPTSKPWFDWKGSTNCDTPDWCTPNSIPKLVP